MMLPSFITRLPREAVIWTLGLVGLAVLGPTLEGHLTFCIPSWLGMDFCWGCGLGRSIGHAARGEFATSWEAHPLGMVTIGVLAGRIISLVYRSQTTSRGV